MTTLERIAIPATLASIETLDWDQVERRISVSLDCTTLRLNPDATSMYECPAMKRLLKPFPFLSPSAVYWFTIISNHTCSQVFEAIKEGSKTVARKFPWILANCATTDVLYVGEVVKDIRGRLISHTGFGSRPEKQGLQLCHWAQAFGIKVRIYCLILSPDAKNRRFLWEREISKALRPLVGKH